MTVLNYFNYFSEIEELFIRRRGRNLLLSPLDWALIESWQERAVPLHIILSAVEKVFDGADQQPSPRKRAVKSLLYCKEEIEAQYAEWLERQVGKKQSTINSQQLSVGGRQSAEDGQRGETENSDSPKSSLFSNEAMNSHLERVVSEISAARDNAAGDFRQTLAVASNCLTELVEQKSHTAENLEESLEKLDALIDASILRNSDTERLKAEVEKQIASYKNKMEPEVYQRTFDLMLVKRLRQQAAVPRLSLFYL